MIERATGRALLMDFGISRTISAPVDTAGLTRVGVRLTAHTFAASRPMR